MPDTYADTEHTHLEQTLKSLGAKMPTLCNLYYFNHLNMWLANEVDNMLRAQNVLGSFLLPVRLESRPLVVSVTLTDTRSENLCATHVAPSLGEFQDGREWDTWSFLWQTVQTEALPTEAALLAF